MGIDKIARSIYDYEISKVKLDIGNWKFTFKFSIFQFAFSNFECSISFSQSRRGLFLPRSLNPHATVAHAPQPQSSLYHIDTGS